MEVLGVIAGAAQISGNILSIISTIQNVRHQIIDAPLQSKDRIAYLDILCSTVRKFEDNFDLYTEEVAGYLAGIQTKIIHLHSIVTEQLSKLQGGTCRKLRFAITVLKAERRISDSFAGLNRDSNALILYLSVSKDSRAPTTAQHPRIQAGDGGMPHEANSRSRREPQMGCMPSKETHQETPEDAPRETRTDGAKSANDIVQTFGPLTAKGIDSKNDIGNIESASTIRAKQGFDTADAQDGAVNKAGNIVIGQRQDTDAKKNCDLS